MKQVCGLRLENSSGLRLENSRNLEFWSLLFVIWCFQLLSPARSRNLCKLFLGRNTRVPGSYPPNTRTLFSGLIRVVFEIVPEREGSALCGSHIVDCTSSVFLIKEQTMKAAFYFHLFYAESSSDSHQIKTDKALNILAHEIRNL